MVKKNKAKNRHLDKRADGTFDLRRRLLLISAFVLIFAYSVENLTAQDSFGKRVKKFFGADTESSLSNSNEPPVPIAPEPMKIAKSVPSTNPLPLSDAPVLIPSPQIVGEKNKARLVSGGEFLPTSKKTPPPEWSDKPFISDSPDLSMANETSPNMIRTVQNLTSDEIGSIITDQTDANFMTAPSVLEQTDKEETLEQAWNIALEASRTLAAKDYDRSKADADIRAARGLGLPKVTNASGVHTVSEELAIQTDVPLSQLSPILPNLQLETPIADKDFATSVTALTIPIYMGGRVRGMIEAAQAASNAVAFGKQISQQDLKYEVAQTYFLVLRVRRLREVAVEAEQSIASHETDAQRFFENGIVTKNVILAAQVARANAAQDVIKASNAVRLSEAAYNRLLWRSLDSPVRIVDMEIPETSDHLETLTAEAIARRPELAALAYKSQALAAEAKVHRADRLPQVAAVGSHNYLENSHLNENSTFSGSLGVVWTPFDGGISRNRQEASSFEAMSVTREHEDAQSKIELQVYQCWLDEQETRHRVEVAQKTVDQADENLRVVTRGFKEGLANHTEVLDAQTLRTQAWSNLANARYDAILATYHLRRAVGEL